MMLHHYMGALLFLLISVFRSVLSNDEFYCIPGQTVNAPLNGNAISYVSTINFPNSLQDYFQQPCSITIEPESGFGVRILFEEFFVGRHDKLTIKTATGEEFIREGGVTDPERGNVAYYQSPGAMNLIFTQRDEKPIGINHAGFRAVLKPFNMSIDDATQCGGVQNLTSTFFDTSFAYPQDFGAGRNCSWTFTAEANIRILFYDFRTDNSTDSFVITGQRVGANNSDSMHLGGGGLTSDLAVAFYYKQRLSIDFTSGKGFTFPSRRFSFIIDAYGDPPTTERKCEGAEVAHNMSAESSVAISTTGYLTTAYEDYLQCYFSFTDPPPSHMIYVNMIFESERCCDTMVVQGIGKDYIFQGERYPTIYFANSPNVSLDFTSDGVRTASGFRGTVSTIDCGCKNVTIDAKDGDDYWIESPGFGNAPTYCPEVDCFWEVRAHRNQTLDLTAFSVGLRISDQLQITDVAGRQTQSLTIASNSGSQKYLATISTGYVAFRFTSVQCNYVEFGSLMNGFRIHVEANSINYNQTEKINLSDANGLSKISVDLQTNDVFLWHVKARPNRNVTLYAFGTLSGTGALLDIFDGDNIYAPILSQSDFFNPAALVNETSQIHSSGEALTFRLIGTSQMRGSLRFFAVLSDIISDSYAQQCSEPLVKGFSNEQIIKLPQPSNSSIDGGTTTTSTTISSSTVPVSTTPTPPVIDCVMILHEVLPSSELRSGLAVEILDGSDVRLYKGATLSDSTLLASEPPYPNFVFGGDVTFAYSSDQPPLSIGVRSTSMLRDYAMPMAINGTTGYLFSPDFLSDTDLGRVYQRYELSTEGEDGFHIEVVNPIHNCQVLLQGDFDGTPALHDNLLKLTPSLDACVTNMAVIYRSNGGVGKGLFLKYTKGSEGVCPRAIQSGVSSKQQSTSVILLSVLMCLRFAQ